MEVPSLLPMYPYAVLASSFSKNLCLAGERVGFIALSPLFAERAELMGGLTLANRILGFVNPPVVGQHIMAGARIAGGREHLCPPPRNDGQRPLRRGL